MSFGGGGGRGRGWGSNRGGRGSMPAAPGAQLDGEAMQGVLGSNTTHSTHAATRASLPQQQQQQQQQQQRMPSGAMYASALAQRATASSMLNEEEATTPTPAARQPFDAYVVLDFEATCEENRRIPNPEVIEFPFVVVDPDTLTIVAEFQRYVRPVQSPTLSAFCTSLTGIDQSTVDQAQPFPEVYREALRYLREDLGLGDSPPARSYCVVTCGDWNLKTMLPVQTRLSGNLTVPAGLRQWCNIKTFMKQAQPPFLHRGRPARVNGLPDMLEAVGLQLEGHHHSGIDDCRNIARVLLEVMKRGHLVRPTFSLDRNVSAVQEWRLAELNPEQASALPPLSSAKSDLSPFRPPAPPPQQPSAAVAQAQAQQPASKQTRRERAGAQGATRTSERGSGKAIARLPSIVVDATRDPVADILAANPNAHQLAAGEQKSVSKALSYVLRHGADDAGIPVTMNGFCRLSDLLKYPPLSSRKRTPVDVAYLVSSNDKQRFRMVYEQGSADNCIYVAAAQGHSLTGVEVDMKAIQKAEDVSEVVIHGTYWDAFRQIRQCGYLSAMSRHHIHFAKGFPKESGVISGMRASASVVLYLDVAKCLEDGVPLLESANGVILTPGVGDTRRLPLKYISKAVDRDSGAKLSLDAL